MRLALIADVHENVAALRAILAEVRLGNADEIIFLGDFADPGKRIEETVCLLEKADAVGVWGNHEFGLCAASDDRLRKQYSEKVQKWMLGLRPFLTRGELRFSHVEPWLDATKIENLWYFDGVPQSSQQVARSFDAVPERILFCGHFHRWQLATLKGVDSWDGKTAINLVPPERYFVMLAPAFEGNFAFFDTKTSTLLPKCITF